MYDAGVIASRRWYSPIALRGVSARHGQRRRRDVRERVALGVHAEGELVVGAREGRQVGVLDAREDLLRDRAEGLWGAGVPRAQVRDAYLGRAV